MQALTRDESELFDLIVRNLGMALKNSVLYSSEHPILSVSIDNLKSSLDRWFSAHASFALGIAQDELFLGSASAGKGSEPCAEVANHLHVRGVISITFLSGIEVSELKGFFSVVKDDKKAIRDRGGVVKNVPPSAHMIIKEIDYGTLLHGEASAAGGFADEDKVWQFLFDAGKDIKAGQALPESSMEFVREFFSDAERSASVINKVYKEAMADMRDEDTARSIQATVARICDYFEKHSSDKGRKVKVELMKVVSRLSPDLIKILFEKTVVDDRSFDMAEEVIKDLPDNYIAGFIESLIGQEGTLNEMLLKVFDKLTPGETKANNVVTMVADRLIGRHALDADALSKLQMSVKEIFKAHPQSNFMSQMYNITVDAVANKKIDALIYIARLSPILNRFAQSMAVDKLNKEKMRLLLNILWLESDPLEFNKFSSKLADMLPDLLGAKDTSRVREILEFFTEKIRPEQLADAGMSEEINGFIRRMTSKEAIDGVIAMIPDAEPKSIDDISDILFRAGAGAASPLVDAFLAEKNPSLRSKYRAVFAKCRKAVVEEDMNRLEYADASAARDLLGVLKQYDPDRANLVAKRLICSRDPRIRCEGLEAIVPKTREDLSGILAMFGREKNGEVAKKAAAVLLETREREIIDGLFECVRKNFFKRRFLLHIVEACGRVRCYESFPNLERIFREKYVFATPYRDNLRVAVVTALGRFRTPEAMAVVKEGLSDRSQKVRKLCEILVKLGINGPGAASNADREGKA